MKISKDVLNIKISLRGRGRIPGKVGTYPTPSGYGFLGLVIAGFLLSINFSSNLIFAMTFLLVAIALVGWYDTRKNVSAVFFGEWDAEPVFAGQDAQYRIYVENRSKRDIHGIKAAASIHREKGENHLSKGDGKEVFLGVPAPVRGRLTPGDARLESTFPLGIFKAFINTATLPSCMVYPNPWGDQPYVEKNLGSQAHLMAESGTYTDMRRYAPGDPLSRISWKAFAKFDALYTKEFDGARGETAMWIRYTDVDVPGVEEKLSQLCLWVLKAHEENREFGLELPGTRIEPDSGKTHLQECLAALAFYGDLKPS